MHNFLSMDGVPFTSLAMPPQAVQAVGRGGGSGWSRYNEMYVNL